MHRIRVLKAGVPPILSDIVRALAAQEPDVEIVAEVGRDADLPAAVTEFEADVVMVGAAEASPELDAQLLLAHPHLRVLTFTADRRVSYLDRLVPERTVITDVSGEGLIQAILGTGDFG